MSLSLNCITGNDDHLYKKLQQSIHTAESIDIIVSFLMESGVKLLAEDLKYIKDQNIPIRILTGNYLNITQPSALYLLKDIFGDNVDLRFYKNTKKSFHAKAYIFNRKAGGEIFVGSSNLSKSALTDAIEWNYRIEENKSPEDFKYFKDIFEDLFLNESEIIDDLVLKNYSDTWKKPKINVNYEQKSPNINYVYNEGNLNELFSPRGAQIEALYHLNKTRLDGNDKALVVAATGVGKTYLAAFDSREFNKILFVAHREEILKQAYDTFKSIRHDKHISFNEDKMVAENYINEKSYNIDGYSMGFFMNKYKDTDKDIIFASVQSLGKSTYLNENYFKENYFDYIIVDEFHHAVSSSYQNIINYFKPKFMLGLTATPDRLDNKDVFSICDYNTVYEVNLKTAINKSYLVPFRYYGVYDDSVDYDDIAIKNGKYDEKQLEVALSIHKRADLILNNYKKYKSKRCLAFCINRNHAEFMAKYFNENGVPAACVHSGDSSEFNENRNIAIKKLIDEKIKVIFSVDMFNEGVDIKSLDMVMFLRPTESPTIFLQQLGRGLRKDKDKKYLNVLDFIGNYKKINLIPYLLTGKSSLSSNHPYSHITEDDYPEDCFIDFDFRIVNLFEKFEKANTKIEQLILNEYFSVKELLGHRPSRTELFTYMDDNIFRNMKSKSALNVFKDYLDFLDKNNELTEDEKSLLNSDGHEFIKFIENTSMSKTYKIPVLLAFYNDKNLKLKIDDMDLFRAFKKFYHQGSNKVDMLRDKSTSSFETWNEAKYISLARRNPVKYLCKSSSEFFSSDKDFVYLDDKLAVYAENEFFLENFIDAVNFRVKEYYKTRFLNSKNK